MSNDTTTQWSAVPAAIKKRKAWLLWEKTSNPDKPGKFGKVPHYIDGSMRRGVQGSDLDRKKMGTFKQAVTALEKYNGRFAGIGIAALKGEPWAALDLDNVLDHTEAREVADLAVARGAYVEKSPSGKGLRAFIKSTGLGKRQNHDIGIELFEDSGFVTVTGDVLSPGGVGKFIAGDLDTLKKQLPKPIERDVDDKTPPPEWERFDLTKLNEDLRTLVIDGFEKGDDRSTLLFTLCKRLLRAGLSRENVFNIIADTNLPWYVIGEDRGGGSKQIRKWLWEYNVKSAFAKEQAIADERQEALQIGKGDAVAPDRFPILTLDEMLGRFVYLKITNEICDTQNPRLAMPYGHFLTLTASSKMATLTPGGRPTTKPVAGVWKDNQDRHNIDTRTWLPGGDKYLKDPENRDAVNIWVPPQVGEAPADWKKQVEMFLEHIEYLVPDPVERKRFLQWLAHIERHPQERVQGHYLMIAPNTQGVGRNWVSSLLVRVWPGNVALNLIFERVMGKGFNDELSEKFLGVIDELHEGGKNVWTMADQMKSAMTAEWRYINPKYGKKHTEYDVLRWLMFSNSMQALPLTEFDRRFWVIENPSVVRETAYYEKLYGSLRDAGVVRSVKEYLRVGVSLDGFKANERPPINAVKRELIAHSENDQDRAFRALMEGEREKDSVGDVVTTGFIQEELWGDVPPGQSDEGRRRSSVMRNLYTKWRCQSLGQLKVKGENVKVVALRNVEHWKDVYKADKALIRAEVEGHVKDKKFHR